MRKLMPYGEKFTYPDGKWLVRVYGREPGSGVLYLEEGKESSQELAKKKAHKVMVDTLNEYGKAK